MIQPNTKHFTPWLAIEFFPGSGLTKERSFT